MLPLPCASSPGTVDQLLRLARAPRAGCARSRAAARRPPRDPRARAGARARATARVCRSSSSRSPRHQAICESSASASKRPTESASSNVVSAFSASARGARQVGVAQQGHLSERGERAAQDGLVAGLLRELVHRLHLDGDRRQVVEPPRRTRRLEAPVERRLELHRAQQEPARGAVGLAGERPAPGRLERRGGLRHELRRDDAVELLQQRRRLLEVVGADLDELVGGALPEPAGEPPGAGRPGRPSSARNRRRPGSARA